jgi:hypothetical protein
MASEDYLIVVLLLIGVLYFVHRVFQRSWKH